MALVPFLAVITAGAVSYLLGAIPAGFILTKLFKGVDIRDAGSGNVGATNVLRVVGKVPAAITLLFDIAKGIFAVTVVVWYSYPGVENILDYDFYRAMIGLLVISGHIWPVFLGFRGGKGVATTIGVLSIIAPYTLVSALGVWLILFLVTNYVSVASIGFGIFLPIFSLIYSQPFYTTILTVTLCFINSYKHSSNIQRLLKGVEHKTILFKKKS